MTTNVNLKSSLSIYDGIVFPISILLLHIRKQLGPIRIDGKHRLCVITWPALRDDCGMFLFKIRYVMMYVCDF